MTRLRLKGWVVVKAGHDIHMGWKGLGKTREDAITNYFYDTYHLSFHGPQHVEKVWTALKEDDVDLKEIDVEIELP